MGKNEVIKTKDKKLKIWQISVAVGLVLLFTSMHYMTDMHDVAFHNVYRRLYYLPILILSFSHGLKGGLSAALLVTTAYSDHAFFSDHRDPSPDIDKLLEIALYFVVGGLTGWLVERQRKVQAIQEQTLKEKNLMERQLVRAGRLSALGELTSGLAHEIRNPLASILGAAEALASDFPETHRKHRIAELLLHEINRLGQVVDDFLRFAKPSQASHKIIDLYDTVGEVLALTANHAQNLNPEVEVRPDEMLINGDQVQVSQVLLNVLLNAYQALERQGNTDIHSIKIVSDTHQVGKLQFHRLGVRDNGPGIPQENMEDVFNPYFTTRDEGTGLGLSISNRIMEAHNGYIDIDSKAGQTTVWLSFPKENSL